MILEPLYYAIYATLVYGKLGYLNTCNLAKHLRKPQILNKPLWILAR